MRRNGVVVRVPGKVNLQLSVGPLEADGYHEVTTVFQAISIYDDVTVKFAEPGSGISLTVTGTTANGVPVDSSNLAYRAAQMMIDRHDLDSDISLHIKKEIPVAGGMAGGSADAAAVMVAFDALYDLGLSRDGMEKIGAELGSDVPFSITGGIAIGRGHGDHLTPVLARGSYHWVLAMAPQGLSTQSVYHECDRLRTGLDISRPQVSDQILQALRAGDAASVGKSLAPQTAA